MFHMERRSRNTLIITIITKNKRFAKTTGDKYLKITWAQGDTTGITACGEMC